MCAAVVRAHKPSLIFGAFNVITAGAGGALLAAQMEATPVVRISFSLQLAALFKGEMSAYWSERPKKPIKSSHFK